MLDKGKTLTYSGTIVSKLTVRKKSDYFSSVYEDQPVNIIYLKFPQ